MMCVIGGTSNPQSQRFLDIIFLRHLLTWLYISTRVASHLAHSDTPGITCIVARISRSGTQQCYEAPPTNGKARRAPLTSAAQGLHAKFHNEFNKKYESQKYEKITDSCRREHNLQFL